MSARYPPVVFEMSVGGHLVDRYGQVRTTLVPGCLSLGSRTLGGHLADTFSLLDLTRQYGVGERVSLRGGVSMIFNDLQY